MGNKCGLSGFGVTLLTNNSLEMIHQLLYYAKKSMGIYFDNPIV